MLCSWASPPLLLSYRGQTTNSSPEASTRRTGEKWCLAFAGQLGG